MTYTYFLRERDVIKYNNYFFFLLKFTDHFAKLYQLCCENIPNQLSAMVHWLLQQKRIADCNLCNFCNLDRLWFDAIFWLASKFAVNVLSIRLGLKWSVSCHRQHYAPLSDWNPICFIICCWRVDGLFTVFVRVHPSVKPGLPWRVFITEVNWIV